MEQFKRGEKWWIAYVGVLSIRLHPKNDSDNKDADIDAAVAYALTAADAALAAKILLDDTEGT